MFKKKPIFFLSGMILCLFLCLVIIGSCHNREEIQEEKPVVVFTNSGGEKTDEFAVMDSVFGSFSSLLPVKKYTIMVIRSDGKEISHSLLSSDKQGIIPTIALWWDVGAQYEKSRVGKLDVETLFKHSYYCLVKREKQEIAKIPIRIKPLEETGPIIYSSNEKGDPLNGFIYQKERVYITGMNFPTGCAMHVQVVKDCFRQEREEEFEPVMKKPLSINLTDKQRNFNRLVLDEKSMKVGAYDLLVRLEEPVEPLYSLYLRDSIYNVGFTVFKPLPPPSPTVAHVEAELACQAPPQDPATGTVTGAPNPLYKNYFAANEQVWAAVNPYAGGQDYVGQNARLYVVYDKTEQQWTDGMPLTDVSTDGYETVTIQPGCANVNYTKVWSNPTVRDQGYDVVVDFSPFGSYTRGKDIVDKVNVKGFVVPSSWVCLESVSFNYNTASAASDAMNIRMNYTQDVVIPEWQKNKKSYPAAYIKSNTIAIQAVFTAAPGVTSAQVRATKMYGLLGDVNLNTVNFTNGTSNPVIFQVSGNTPNDVEVFTQKWRWYSKNINNANTPEIHLGDSQNRIFNVLAQPQSPWTASGQSEPWVDVLNEACWRAKNETTVEGAAGKMTHYLYSSTGGLYVYVSRYTTGSNNQSFNLTGFLNNIPNIGFVNCYDMGKSLVIFSNVLGCGLSYKYSDPFGSLHCIKAIGRNWNCCERFGNHGFGSITSYVYDACLTVDGDADPDNPPHVEEWMINILWDLYKQKVVKTGSPGNPVAYSFGIY